MTIILCCFALNEVILLRETELSNITNISKVVLLTAAAAAKMQKGFHFPAL